MRLRLRLGVYQLAYCTSEMPGSVEGFISFMLLGARLREGVFEFV